MIHSLEESPGLPSRPSPIIHMVRAASRSAGSRFSRLLQLELNRGTRENEGGLGGMET